MIRMHETVRRRIVDFFLSILSIRVGLSALTLRLLLCYEMLAIAGEFVSKLDFDKLPMESLLILLMFADVRI